MNQNDNYIARARPYSKATSERLWETWHCCKQADHEKIPGVFVECGVWRGGNVMVMRWASPSRQIWLYDTFEGMTAPGEHDGEKANRLFGKNNAILKAGGKKSVATADEVLQNLIKENVFERGKIAFVIGDVRKTLLKEELLPKHIAVLRLDTDFYDSTKIELEVLFPLLSHGGYLLIDDYGHWPGCRKAVDEYLGDKKSLLQMSDYTGAWMVKP